MHLTIYDLYASALLGLVSGILIGCIGVGGVILVPALVQIVGVSIHAAIPAAMAGYILTGLVASQVFVKKETLDWRSVRLLWIGAMPASIAGALIAKVTPSFALEFAIAILTAVTGIQTLVRRPQKDDHRKFAFSSYTGIAIGALTGLLSALTGTGGPVVLIPILLWLDVPVLLAIGLAQTIQLPIALLATIGNVVNRTLDQTLGLTLSAGLVIGSWFGARLAHRLNQSALRRFVATVLLGTGLLLLFRVAGDVFSSTFRVF